VFCLPLVESLGAYGTQDQATLNAKRTFKRFEETVVYVWIWEHGGNGTNITSTPTTFTNNGTYPTPMFKSTYFPTVDDYSSLSVPDTGLRWRDRDEVVIWVELGGVKSEMRHYKSPYSPDLFRGSFTLLVTLDQGKIFSLTWDDDKCKQCTDSECIYEDTDTTTDRKTCGLKYSDTGDCSDSKYCNLQVMLAWQGKDTRGTYCTSAGLVPSKADQWSIYPVYKVAAGVTKSKIFTKDPFSNVGNSGNHI